VLVGACLGFRPFYARSMVFTMPEFLERRFSLRSRYVLSAVSIVTFIVSKIAVGIFAGGVVFGALLPEVQVTIAGHLIDSFWIGLAAGDCTDRLYTVLGGMRAVAYNDAIQVVILIGGSAMLTFYGLATLGGWSELKAIWRLGDVQPLEADHARRCHEFRGRPFWRKTRRVRSSSRHGTSTTRFRGSEWPSARPSSDFGTGAPTSTLSSGALGAPNEKEARRGSIFAAGTQAVPGLPLHHPGPYLLRARQERQSARP